MLAARSRDNGRTPMQWDGSRYAGFTQGSRGLTYRRTILISTRRQEAGDSGSILNYYKRLSCPEERI
ncbi:MAG: hypothetical protein ACLR0U_33340 [Enterocloster clostridioformis]